MPSSSTVAELEEALAEIPFLDPHTHLVGGKLAAQGLHDILLYHMAVSDLYAAGCPSGNRLTEYPGWPSPLETRSRILEALPYLPLVRNTSTAWLVGRILADLYGWAEPVTAENWEKLDGLVRERASDPAWPYAVLKRAGIHGSVSELARREAGQEDAYLQYSLEWAFFTRCQWGEYDTALYELERCWGRTPESPSPVTQKGRPATQRQIRTLEDVQTALAWYVETIPYADILSTATHISTEIDFRPVSEAEMAAALDRRPQAGAAERDIYASYVHEAFLDALEARSEPIVFQFSLGAEPLPFETGSRLSQKTIAALGEMIARHPGLQFQCMLASRQANLSLCTLGRELPNFSLVGYWWHNFFPEAIRQVMGERLDMLPVNKQVGFFSDAYCVEWSYAKSRLVRKLLAQVLGQRIEQGQYSLDDALSIARAICYDAPQTLLGMRPK